MNLAALRTFLAIVETGSLIRASERLNVTQSTVTARLKGLEDELGQSLFVRQRTGARLTAAGARFHRYAATMSDLWTQALQETALPQGIESVCNIGCHTDLWPGLGRRLFEAVRTRAPSVALSAWPGGPSDLDAWLQADLVNVALSFQPYRRDGRTTRPILRERLVLVSTRPEAPARFDPGYVFVDGGEDFGRQHAVAYADADTATVSFGSAVWALEHLLAHGGSAYLPERLAADAEAGGRLFRIAGAPAFSRTVYAITNDAAAAEWPWLEPMIAELSG